MTSRVAIVAALERELRPLVKGWKTERGSEGARVYSTDRTIAVAAGMGARCADLATRMALSFGPVHRIISTGWVGGLDEQIKPGSVHYVDVVIDVSSGERFLSGREARSRDMVLASVGHVASATEKRHLREDYRASLVDMEAAAVARIAREERIPFLAIKGVSDDLQADLPPMELFIDELGQMSEGRFATYVALRPTFWKPVLELARASGLAARNLAAELERYLAWEQNKQKISPRA